MDNFLEVLIWLIVIISLFSGFFKKKGKTKNIPEPLPDNSRETNPTKTGTAESKDDYDIMKEIEALFKMDNEESSEQKPTVRKEGELKTASESQPTYSEHTKDERVSWDEKTSYESPRASARIKHTPESGKARPVRTITAVPEIPRLKPISYAVDIDSASISKKNYRADEIKEKLKSKINLKEYILISEIIGKPKSLID